MNRARTGLLACALVGTLALFGCSTQAPNDAAVASESDGYDFEPANGDTGLIRRGTPEIDQRIVPTTEFGERVEQEYRLESVEEPKRRAKTQDELFVNLPPAEELWIIERLPEGADASPSRDDNVPGSGALVTSVDGKDVPVPLAHTAVEASVRGYISSVTLTQQFQNPFDEKIEAVYVFPLPRDAAVNEFIMTIGERRIRGIVREREEAKKIYEAARQRGHTASLLSQTRPNVFTQKVANIEPGNRIDVTIRYLGALEYYDGWYEFVFPMVVGPRYNPPGHVDGVGAVARNGGGSSRQATEVSYLRPEERSGHDISVKLDIDAGVAIESIASPSHDVAFERPSDRTARVTLGAAQPSRPGQSDLIPNKDLVVRFRVAGKQLKSRLMAHRGERDGYFTMMIYPPADLDDVGRVPLDVVFVLDCSGSMSGTPLNQSKACVEHALSLLGRDDTFQIIRFSESASGLGTRPLRATDRNLGRALGYLDSLNSGGGTKMIEGIRAALSFPRQEGRQRVVAFLTDGYIGNETEIFREIDAGLDDARIFSFGVGSSVNRHLLAGLAHFGRGAVAFVGPREDPVPFVDHFFRRVSRPALEKIEIDWGGLEVHDVFPPRPADLFVGRAVLLTGRFRGETTGVTIRGRAGGQPLELRVEVDASSDDPGDASSHTGIPFVWARRQIQFLARQLARKDSDELRGEILRVALEHGIVSAETSFVAVDALHRSAGDPGRATPVPVRVPDGVRYDTTVGGN